jgi:hypothetical protein
MSGAKIHVQRNEVIVSVDGRTSEPASIVEAPTSCHDTKFAYSTTIPNAMIDADVEANVIY